MDARACVFFDTDAVSVSSLLHVSQSHVAGSGRLHMRLADLSSQSTMPGAPGRREENTCHIRINECERNIS